MTPPPAVLPEGSLLDGRFEVGPLLTAAGDANLYFAFGGEPRRPTRHLLLARPGDAPTDLRPIDGSSDAARTVVPAVAGAFSSHGQQILALAHLPGELLSHATTPHTDEAVLELLLALAGGLRELLALGASLAWFGPDTLLLDAGPVVRYVGPVVPAVAGPSPVAVLAALATRLCDPRAAWTEELTALVERLGAGPAELELGSAVAALEVLARPALAVRTGAVSHVGTVRAENQDVVSLTRHDRLGGESYEADIVVLADGLGGHRAGRLAATLAVGTFHGALAMGEAVSLSAGIGAIWHDNNSLVGTLDDAFEAAAETVASLGEPNEGAPPGATMVTLVRAGRRLVINHLGDSRAYFLRAGRLERLTRDDSALAGMVAQGLLSEEETFGHPDASAVTRYVGDGSDSLPSRRLRLLRPGDRLMICSDGLTDVVRDEELAGLLRNDPGEPSVTAAALVAAGLAAGSGDNVTVAVLDVVAAEA